jgi:RNA polymerase sigma-70 factor
LRKEIKNLNVKGMDENNLTILLQQGDRNAYKQLFIKYYSPLCEYASQYISDDDSEELVQELMLFLWETRENLVIETSLKSYLFISTKHRCLNAIRKNQYHERIHNQIYEKIKDQFEDPDYYFVNELTENIQKAIENLPETYRETFAMSRFGEKTNVQIAEKLGISVKTVEYRISQALKILRFKLKDYLPLLINILG